MCRHKHNYRCWSTYSYIASHQYYVIICSVSFPLFSFLLLRSKTHLKKELNKKKMYKIIVGYTYALLCCLRVSVSACVFLIRFFYHSLARFIFMILEILLFLSLLTFHHHTIVCYYQLSFAFASIFMHLLSKKTEVMKVMNVK